jgi:uncharacterized protein YjiS (DUF1127 family)
MSVLTLPSIRRMSLTGMFQAALRHRALGQSRRRLAQLDDHLLQDIGLNREAALAEAGKGVWDAPDHWYR